MYEKEVRTSIDLKTSVYNLYGKYKTRAKENFSISMNHDISMVITLVEFPRAAGPREYRPG